MRRRAGLDDYFQKVAESLVKEIERGTAPWVQAWEPGVKILPYNVKTGKTYRGGNSVFLASEASKRGFGDERWGTYRQIQEMGGQVRKGERGCAILFWQFEGRRLARDENGKPVLDESDRPVYESVRLRSPRVYRYTVFNAEQATGLPDRPDRAPGGYEWDRHQDADRVIGASGASIRHSGQNVAAYDMAMDRITLPFKHQYPTAAGYYQSALHEMGHWTGHPDRLNRTTLLQGMRQGPRSSAYAREELRAEISSMITGDRLSLGHDPKRSANYVGAWVTRLRKDPLEVYRASRDAQHMSDFLLDRARVREHTRADRDRVHHGEPAGASDRPTDIRAPVPRAGRSMHLPTRSYAVVGAPIGRRPEIGPDR
ncbi:MAG: zincin-like metallopeptidase domain-containing protein [Bryobacterales bacterium]|nr:zincin-like metallopeptidase domain-containing protein [Bryobacterales bacterium]